MKIPFGLNIGLRTKNERKRTIRNEVLFALISVATFVSILVSFTGNPHFFQGNIIQFDMIDCEEFQPNMNLLDDQIQILQDTIVHQENIHERIAVNRQKTTLESKKELLQSAYNSKCK